jgi:hypothetical protein
MLGNWKARQELSGLTGARRLDVDTIADMATHRPRSRWKILVALMVMVPLLATVVFVAVIDLGNRSGECGEYYGDGTNSWEDCIEFGTEVVDNGR